MAELCMIKGVIASEPACFGAYNVFELNDGEHGYHIIRLEPKWQKLDELFLRVGQTVLVYGMRKDTQSRVLFAYRIIITEHQINGVRESDGIESICRIDESD